MSQLGQIPSRDQEELSAYIDDRLAPEQVAALERRLEQEPRLRQALDELRHTVSALRSLPRVSAPRSFALTPDMAGQRSRPSYPVLQLGTALAALALVLTVGLDALGARQQAGMQRMVSAQAGAPAAESETGAVSLFAAPATVTPAETAQPATADMVAQGTPEPPTLGAAAQTACPGCPAEAPGTLSASAEKASATATLAPPAPQVGPVAPSASPARPAIPTVRVVEIVLAALTLVLGALSLRLRRRRGVS